MKVTATIVFAYSVLILLGGLIGHLKAGSSASLISGLCFGVALSLCAYAIAKGKILAQYLALILTFILDGFFTFRFAKTLHFVPAGMMSLLSLAVIIVIALKIRRSVRDVS
ncbi:MAG TPA: TMEM14 family protein [Rhabdochlamydiaceae bacterium]|jgi:uncharacterized membrane protein (UPF0136 family)